MKNSHNTRHVILFIVLAFLSGMLGSYLQNFSSDTLVNDTPPETQQTEVMREVLPENAVIDVAEKMHESVVSIVATKELEYVMRDPFSFFFDSPFRHDPFFNDFFGTPHRELREPEVRTEKRQVGAGTGFVISEDGLLLTNKHVVNDDEAEYTVFFADEREYTAEVVTRDPTNDLAILKIKDSEDQQFTPAKFIANTQNIKIGQFVVAIGNALGQFENTMTLGIISAKSRNITAGDGRGSAENLSELLQTDAAINPGNSGGPLVALSGEVLGVNTAIAGGAEGIGFAIPIDQTMVTSILEQIETYGKIVKPFLGVRYQLITPELNAELKLGSDYGAWLHGENDLPAVVADTPAAEAGLKGGDIILSVDGEDIAEDTSLMQLISKHAPNDTIELEILRDGKKQKLNVTLGEWDEHS